MDEKSYGTAQRRPDDLPSHCQERRCEPIPGSICYNFFNRQGESVVFIVVKFELCFVLCFPPFLFKNFKEGSV